MAQTMLQTPRLITRAAQLGDTQDLHICFSNPQVMKYWSTSPHTDLSQTTSWLSKMISSPQNGVTDFVIEHRPTSTVIGKIGIWHGCEIGFMISHSYWRQGIASEALGVVLPYFFNEKEFDKIVADVDPRNEGSLSVLQRFGFEVVGRREKSFEIGGVWVDSLDLELSREAWMENRESYKEL